MYKKLKVICDCDDVLMSCNQHALDMLIEEERYYYHLSSITGWGMLGKDVDRRFKFFKEKEFYETQPALPGAKEFLRELMQKADVFLVTAVAVEFMGERITRIRELFPEFPLDHVIMGKRKDLMQADVILDDRVENLLETKCALSVLFDQPWNSKATGLIRVNDYGSFLTLIDFLNGKKSNLERVPKAICLVGPSGSRKQELATKLGELPEFEHIKTYTTAKARKGLYESVSAENFSMLKRTGEFIETTWYSGERYGTTKHSVEAAFAKHCNPVLVMDISGCMSMYNQYPGQCRILYVERDKKDCIISILQKPALRRDQIADRIISGELEEKNSVLADHVIKLDPDDADLSKAVRDVLFVI